MKRYIVIDDDAISNLITKMTIHRYQPEAEVIVFQNPEEALHYMSEQGGFSCSTVLLDINMPTMTGWEFLAQFEGFKEEIRNQYDIFMLSSSFEDPAETENHKSLCGYFSKPLKEEYLREIGLKKEGKGS